MEDREEYKLSNEGYEALIGLLQVLKEIEVSPERIAQNQWKSVDKDGNVEFYY